MKMYRGTGWTAGLPCPTLDNGMKQLEGTFRVPRLGNPMDLAGEEVGLVLMNELLTIVTKAIVVKYVGGENDYFSWVSTGVFHPGDVKRTEGKVCFVFAAESPSGKERREEAMKLIKEGVAML